jgi:hypothetical protein
MAEDQLSLLQAQNRIAQWMTETQPILLPGSSPITSTPFASLESAEIEPFERSVRLGFIYQDLCRQLFIQHPGYEIVAEEVQLQSGKTTIGAIDFLLRHEDAIEHWEVALKFYLLKGGQWYGPDSRDRLDKKLHRMLTHQLKMSETEAFAERFPDVQKVIPKLLMQGRLYLNPFEEERVPEQCCGYTLNPDSVNGYWCYQHQAHRIGEALYKLAKPDWLTGTDEPENMLNAFPDYSVHCQSESGHFWMVVPEHWPT